MNKNLPKRLLKRFLHRVYRPVIRSYLQQQRTFRYRGIAIRVFAGVFHPGFFFSTKLLIDYLAKFDLNNKTFLELGAGTGLIAIVAARKGAVVTATDISKKSLDNIDINKQLNLVSFKNYYSDLFDYLLLY